MFWIEKIFATEKKLNNIFVQLKVSRNFQYEKVFSLLI